MLKVKGCGGPAVKIALTALNTAPIAAATVLSVFLVNNN